MGSRLQALRRAWETGCRGLPGSGTEARLEGPWGLNSRCSIYRRSWTPGSLGSFAGTVTVQSCSSWTVLRVGVESVRFALAEGVFVQGWGHAQFQTSGLIWELPALWGPKCLHGRPGKTEDSAKRSPKHSNPRQAAAQHLTVYI